MGGKLVGVCTMRRIYIDNHRRAVHMCAWKTVNIHLHPHARPPIRAQWKLCGEPMPQAPPVFKQPRPWWDLQRTYTSALYLGVCGEHVEVSVVLSGAVSVARYARKTALPLCSCASYMSFCP